MDMALPILLLTLAGSIVGVVGLVHGRASHANIERLRQLESDLRASEAAARAPRRRAA